VRFACPPCGEFSVCALQLCDHRGHASLRPTLLSCGSSASRRFPRDPAPHWFGAPTPWFRPPRGFQSRGAARLTDRHPPSGLDSASESCPAILAPCGASALPRFLAPSAPPIRREPHTPGPSSSRVTLRPRASAAPRRLPPSTNSPIYFNRARSRGSPYRASPDWNRPPLGGASPPAIGCTGCRHCPANRDATGAHLLG
jgi:hypothetical protein